MAKIKKYYSKKNNSQHLWDSVNSYRFSPFLFVQEPIPLGLRFLQENFLAVDGKNVLGLISTSIEKGVPSRIKIDELVFEEDVYDVAKQLIEYVISYYGAKGAGSFFVKVSDIYSDLLNLFVSQYNFRQCSYEKLWKVSRRKYEDYDYNLNVRSFRNSDAAPLAMMYNEALVSHFRPSLSLTAKSFKECLCRGLKNGDEYRYVIEDDNSSNLLAYISISTKDNENYILEVVHTAWYQAPLDDIIAFACAQIKKRNLNFTLYIKSKKYTVTGMDYEEYCIANKFLQSQTSVLLVKDYYNTVNSKTNSGKFIMLGQPSY